MTIPWRLVTTTLWMLALALAAWTLRQLPYGEMLSRIGRLTAADWLLWTLLNGAILLLAVKRWQVLASALEARLPLATLFRLRQAGAAISFLTPGPHFGGEPLQLYWLHRSHGQPMHQAVASLGLDRFVETASNVTVLLAGVLVLLANALMPFGDSFQVAGILAAMLILLCGAAALVMRHPAWLAQHLGTLARRWDRNHGPDSLRRGWTALRTLLQVTAATQRTLLWLALLLALAGWVALLLELAFLLHVLDLTPAFLDVVFIMVGMRLAMLLPVPGGIGTVEASLLWSFTTLGMPLAAAAGLIALGRLRDAVVLLVGLGCLGSYRRSAGAR